MVTNSYNRYCAIHVLVRMWAAIMSALGTLQRLIVVSWMTALLKIDLKWYRDYGTVITPAPIWVQLAGAIIILTGTSGPLFLCAMWLKEKQMALLATLGVMIVTVIPALYLYLLTKSPLSFEEMDFDDNGIVTFSELNYANSYCVRVIQKDQVICKE